MSQPKFQYAYSAITSNFDLEPVIQDYFTKYPNGEYESYEVVFKTRNEHVEGSYSYLIVYKRNPNQRTDSVKFYDYLKTYCAYNDIVAGENRVVTMNPVSHVLPDTGGNGHTFGTWKK